MLIVDDSDLLRNEIKEKIISRTSYNNIFEADSVDSAKKIILQNQLDIFIIDLSLPDGSGFEILELLKNLNYKALKIILTNYPYEQFRTKAVELGADYFFDKSTEFSLLLEVVSSHIQNKSLSHKNDVEKKMFEVLVVDDSTILRKMVISSLKDIANLSFQEASSGLEAIEQLALKSFNIVILDLNMPDIHGMEVLKFIRSHEMYKNLPVIILTTRSDDDSKNAAYQSGATLYMNKPFLPNELKNNVEKILGL
ncbi:MAG: response regulator [Melioribacteraceae bacterium]|nr:response regulator [Melioribacteraceae bacterium]